MTSKISARNELEIHSSTNRAPSFPLLTFPYGILLNVLVESALAALQWEAIFVLALLDLHNTGRKTLKPAVKAGTFPRLKRPEEAISGQCWERIDVENVGNARTVEQAGRKKRKGKKSSRAKDRQRKERAEKAAEREKEENERLRKWEECWRKKYEAQADREHAECCIDRGLCVKPRTQSNIWINVSQDRSVQEIQMHFKHVPVPLPKPPPLPPLRKLMELEKTKTVDATAQKGERKVVRKSPAEKQKKK